MNTETNEPAKAGGATRTEGFFPGRADTMLAIGQLIYGWPNATFQIIMLVLASIFEWRLGYVIIISCGLQAMPTVTNVFNALDSKPGAVVGLGVRLLLMAFGLSITWMHHPEFGIVMYAIGVIATLFSSARYDASATANNQSRE